MTTTTTTMTRSVVFASACAIARPRQRKSQRTIPTMPRAIFECLVAARSGKQPCPCGAVSSRALSADIWHVLFRPLEAFPADQAAKRRLAPGLPPVALTGLAPAPALLRPWLLAGRARPLPAGRPRPLASSVQRERAVTRLERVVLSPGLETRSRSPRCWRMRRRRSARCPGIGGGAPTV